MTEVIMPKMGDAMEEGTLLEWLKKDGEKVKSGEIIGTIQTDKATLELESPTSGVLSGLLIKAGDTVPVGKPMAVILKDGEALPDTWGSSSNGSAAKSATAAPASDAAPQTAGTAPAPEPATPSEGRVKASPLARRIAAERGIDLATIKGSGPDGRIVEKDLEQTPVKAATPAAASAKIVPTAEDSVVGLTRLRQITAQRTAESMQQAPHYYVSVVVDVDRIQALRDQFEAEESGKASINDFVIRACCIALQQMPVVNSTFQGKEILQHGNVNIGIAAAIDDGLTVPVMHNAHAMTLREIGARSKELVQKARENKLGPNELSGSTFTISNMGMLNIDSFTAIINQPNSAILAVASAKKQVVPNEDDELEIRTQMTLTASFDHRVIDGAIGAQFLNLVRELLENPTRLLS